MKKRYLMLVLLVAVFSNAIQSQSLTQAKNFYEKGEYAKAKPLFAKLTSQQPQNGNYNLWYGVCLLKTGEAAKAVKYLETAVKRRTTGGQLYLGMAYDATYRFEEAVNTLTDYRNELEKRKRSTDQAESLLEKSKSNLRMIKGVEEVCVADSFVVDKAMFLSAYHISPEAGRLYMYDEYFNKKTSQNTTVYETELANTLYYSEPQSDGKLGIVQRSKAGDVWGRAAWLPASINKMGEVAYPYVLADGVTLYFASEGENSMGGYDIFVTRYNPDTHSYLAPQNLGMPFNSPFNDYLYVIDEFSNLGWFASDRYQPEDKVCVYLFITSESKQVYDYEQTDPARMRSLASLQCIKNTWKNIGEVRRAKERLQHIKAGGGNHTSGYDFQFILNDRTVYYRLADFQSPKARVAFQKYQLLQKEYQLQQRRLEDLRESYAKANKDVRQELSVSILDLEKNLLHREANIGALLKEIRNLELSR